MNSESDHPKVVIFPPLVPVSELVLMLLLNWFCPLRFLKTPGVWAVGALLFLAGIGCTVWGRITLVKSGTNVSPLRPTVTIATGGPFRFTRNPLYVGVSILLLGLSILIGTWWGLILLLPSAVVLHYGIILPEERYLEEKFGNQYLVFKQSVRRYL